MPLKTRWSLLFVPALVSAVALLTLQAPLLAQSSNDGFSLMVGLPAAYHFSKDENTNEAPPAKPVSGLRVMLNTPVNLGVGFGSYTSGFENGDDAFANLVYAEREIKYSFLEFLFTIPANIMRFGIGFGLGSAEFSPERAQPLPFIVQDFKKSSAQEWFLMIGAKLSESFGVHFGFHAMTIDAKIETNGVESGGDIGATMASLNASYYF